jgi:hypothetical protein
VAAGAKKFLSLFHRWRRLEFFDDFLKKSLVFEKFPNKRGDSDSKKRVCKKLD